jgi:hypothetical protein
MYGGRLSYEQLVANLRVGRLRVGRFCMRLCVCFWGCNRYLIVIIIWPIWLDTSGVGVLVS